MGEKKQRILILVNVDKKFTILNETTTDYLQMLTLGLNISGLVKDILKPDVLNTFPGVFIR